jgi:hypothetical protein
VFEMRSEKTVSRMKIDSRRFCRLLREEPEAEVEKD